MIQCSRIAKVYRSGRGTLQALSDLSCTVPTGTACAVVGKSGSGKTTLLNCIGGLDRPDEGRVLLNTTDVHALGSYSRSRFVRCNIGFVFQFGNLLSYLTVIENIAFPLVLNGLDKKNQHARVAELLERIGLPDAGKALPQELSGGEVQRVAVARAIAHRPRFLLADEPTASLDTATGRELVALMFSIGREQGCTMLFTTHDTEIIGLADAVIRLRDGKIEGV